MKLSTRTRYAVRGLLDLAEHGMDGVVLVGDIARRQEVAESYLANIFSCLCQAGIVEGVRGRGGGYRLLRPPGQITVLEVAEAMDGDLALTVCVRSMETCHRAADCPARLLWKQSTEALRRMWAATTIKHLLAGHEVESA